jgi:hypothetical protein
MEDGSSRPPEEAGTGYSGAPMAGAALATLFFPFISLIAALLLQGGQSDPRKKSQLRTWAWVAGGWLVFWAVILIVLANVTVGSGSVDRSGPCQGGPKIGATATQIPGKTNEFVQPCGFGGSQTITFPSTTP